MIRRHEFWLSEGRETSAAIPTWGHAVTAPGVGICVLVAIASFVVHRIFGGAEIAEHHRR